MTRKQLLGGLILLLGVVGSCLFSLQVGARDIPFSTVLASFTAYQPADFSEVIIRTLRWPRLLAGVICGTSFAVAGALMQGITHNPMASPSILGINSGASFGLALAMILLPTATLNQTILFSFWAPPGLRASSCCWRPGWEARRPLCTWPSPVRPSAPCSPP